MASSDKHLERGGTYFKYPQELGQAQFPHAVKFYVNARKTVAVNNEIAAFEFTDEERQKFNNENRSSSEQYETAAMISGGLAAAVGTYAAAKGITGEGVSGMMRTVQVGAGAAVGAGIASAVADNMEQVRLKNAISLFIPQSVVAGYTANWDEADLGPVAGMLGTGGISSGDALVGNAAELIGRGLVSGAANIASSVGIGDINFSGMFEATSKKVENPYKEQLFKSMGFRQFSFQYNFSPKNEGEAKEVQDIVKLFKENMHPSVDESGLFLIYPSEFSIEFQSLDSAGELVRNHNLPAISSCALKNVKVTYGPDGMFNAFKNSGGMPTETTMELQFVELETLTRERINELEPTQKEVEKEKKEEKEPEAPVAQRGHIGRSI